MGRSQAGTVTQSRDNQNLTYGQTAWIIGICMVTCQHTNTHVGILCTCIYQGGIRHIDPSNPNALAELASCSPRFRLTCDYHHTIARCHCPSPNRLQILFIYTDINITDTQLACMVYLCIHACNHGMYYIDSLYR